MTRHHITVSRKAGAERNETVNRSTLGAVDPIQVVDWGAQSMSRLRTVRTSSCASEPVVRGGPSTWLRRREQARRPAAAKMWRMNEAPSPRAEPLEAKGVDDGRSSLAFGREGFDSVRWRLSVSKPHRGPNLRARHRGSRFDNPSCSPPHVVVAFDGPGRARRQSTKTFADGGGAGVPDGDVSSAAAGEIAARATAAATSRPWGHHEWQWRANP